MVDYFRPVPVYHPARGYLGTWDLDSGAKPHGFIRGTRKMRSR